MKRFLSMMFAGAVGAVLTFGMIQWLAADQSINNTTNDSNLHTVSTNQPVNGNINTGPDFTVAAEKALPAVVQIQANESQQLAQQRKQEQRSQDPMSRFFDQFGFDFGDIQSFGFPYRPKEGAGSGVIISADGYIVTNNHVVEFADEVTIKTYDEKEYEAQIVGRDPSTDLALLKIDAKNLKTLQYGDSEEVKIGSWVLAVGNPYRYLTSTVTAGIVSAVGRDIDLIAGEKAIEAFIQTDAAINPGNSGGALVDPQGQLIGINTAIASQTGNYAGYSFAIPVSIVMRVVNDIMENGGDVERTSLGVGVLELDEELAKELNLDITEGIYIDEVMHGSAAQYAGILPTDVIVEIDGKKVNNFTELKAIVDYSKVGDVLKVKVYRNGELQTIPVRLKKRI
jgi:Do/DeqQ family serine protease